MFVLFIMIVIGALALFSTLFPEADDKMCHALYRFIMGGEDF